MRFVASVNLVLEAIDEEAAERTASELLANLQIADYQLIEVFAPGD